MKPVIKLNFALKKELYNWVSEYYIELLNPFYNIEISDNPDFVITGNELENQLKYECVRIVHIGENQRPDFNLCDYAIGFDHINFEDRYIRFPLYNLYKKTIINASKKHLHISDNVYGEKNGFCSFVVSNGNAQEQRVQFFDALCNYKKVDSGGRFRNNIGGPVRDKNEFQRKYKFSICFENSSTIGYITEKIFQSFEALTIPIYWGDTKVDIPLEMGGSGLNNNAFINLHRFPTFESAIQKIIEIDSSSDTFINMLREPVFNDENHTKLMENRLIDFFKNILNQKPEDAYRRGFGQYRVGLENKTKQLLMYKQTKYLAKELLYRFGKAIKFK